MSSCRPGLKKPEYMTPSTALSTFLIKLLAMVEDPNYQHLISWSPGGRSFIVHDAVSLAKQVLPKYGLYWPCIDYA